MLMHDIGRCRFFFFFSLLLFLFRFNIVLFDAKKGVPSSKDEQRNS